MLIAVLIQSIFLTHKYANVNWETPRIHYEIKVKNEQCDTLDKIMFTVRYDLRLGVCERLLF